MDQITEKITKFANMPFIAWLLSPFTILLIGTFIGARKESLHFYPFLLLTIFLWMLKAMEIALLKKKGGKLSIPPSIQYSFFIVLAVNLILLTVATNWLVVFLLFLYLTFVLLAFHKKVQMETTVYYLLLHLFFQSFIIGFISYYLQTGFLTIQLIPYFLPTLFLVSPIIMNEQKDLLEEQELKANYSIYQTVLIEKTLVWTLICFIIGIVIAILLFSINKIETWRQVTFLVLLLFFLLPVALKSFRNKVRWDLYIANSAFLITFLFALLLNRAL